LVTEFPVLIAVDRINDWYNPSVFLNPQYSKKYFIDPLPPKRLSLVKAFANFHAHGLSNGTQIVAVDATGGTKRFLKDESDIMSDSASVRVVEPYTKQENFAIMNYYQNIGFIRSEEMAPAGTRNYIWHLTGGSGSDLFAYCMNM